MNQTCRPLLAKFPKTDGKNRKFPSGDAQNPAKYEETKTGNFSESQDFGFGKFPKNPTNERREYAMKFGFRRPSLKKRIAARTSVKRAIRHRMGLKAPRGWGWVTNPRKAAYNRVYYRTTRGCLVIMMAVGATALSPIALLAIWLTGLTE